jgi:Holliday junction DNA helicase RuvB
MKTIDQKLRPKKLSEYLGQDKIKKALNLFIEAAKSRKGPTDHLLFYGPPGIGKTTLAYILANELGGDLKVTSGPAIERTGDLAAILTNLNDKDILFIDEIHRLPKPVEEALYPVLEEFHLDIVLGKGPSARTVHLSIPNITIVGATTKVALLSAPLRDRFGLISRLKPYDVKEIKEIVLRAAKIIELPLTEGAAVEVAKRSRRIPRIAIRILKRVRDLCTVENHKEINCDNIKELFSILEMDEVGLLPQDRTYLKTVVKKFDGGPVGLNTIASALSEDSQTVEEFLEPYLLRLGFIKKTSRGRVITAAVYDHLNLKPPKNE